MLPEFGHLALIFALFLALSLSILPLVGSIYGRVFLMMSARSLASGVFVFVAIAYAVLTWGFYTSDFSIAYVAQNSNLLLPVVYKICGVWGGHEGSLLLWVLCLSAWTFAVSLLSRRMPLDVVARVLSVMGMILVGFLAFSLFTSNPFERILPNIPQDGGDLNPLLQDPGFVIHPPMLYMGYVGFSVVFAFAISALIGGRFDSAWARWVRPWTNAAWSFLTIGIALGSWWAYYELGWGGWWFWDPVENASFMPWLCGTALIHSLAMTEKRGVFTTWTLLLSILTFSLSLLGTFIVRSGVLTSVHAFASDPTRGVFILVFLVLVVGGSLTLFAFRSTVLRKEVGFDILSRETFLLANSFIFAISTFFVLLGTLAPLIIDALNLGKISVGEPYFNVFFPKFMAVVGLLLGLGVMLNWKSTRYDKIKRHHIACLIISLWLALSIPLLMPGQYSISAAMAVFVGAWIITASFADYLRKAVWSRREGIRFRNPGLSYLGMMCAHIGFGVTLLGASIDSIYAQQRDLRISPGEALVVADHSFELINVGRVRGPNYVASRGDVVVKRNNTVVATLNPEKRRYFSKGAIMTEADIDAGVFRDLYVSLGEQINETDWAVRIYFKPLVRWIWFGALLMALGGVIAICDKRYRRVLASDKLQARPDLSSEAEEAQVS